jgi:NTE family protein
MGIKKYIEDATVIKEISDLKAHLKQHPLHVSDLKDEQGYQYIDLVQEGGGVLGIGLLGYTYLMEEVGVRFFSLAGTSAGAINTALLGAAGRPNEKKSASVLELLDRQDLMSFIDGGSDAKSLVESITNGDALLYNAFRQFDDFFIRGAVGINRGDAFKEWLKDSFREFNIQNTQELVDKMNSFPDAVYDKLTELGIEKTGQRARLSVIASDITTQTKADLPRMGDLYYFEPMKVHPADYVRASMSIPVFFDPLVVELLPKGKEQVLKWQNINNAYFFGNIPDKVVFVDGGVMSNFPIDIFHVSNRRPTRPTFGVKLGIDRESVMENNTLAQIIWNSFSAARQMRDHDVILKNPDYIHLITSIDNDGVNWLNFNLSEEDKVKLFIQGVKAACSFIRNFDWEKYKGIRGEMAKKPTASPEAYSYQYSNAFIKK